MPLAGPIRLAIVDDHPLFREGVAYTLGAEPDIEVVGQGVNADDAVRLVQTTSPDILLLDLDIPGGGRAIVTTITTLAPVTRIVILTAAAAEEHVLSALQAGARGYVLKGVAARELAEILRAINAGKGYVPPELAAVLLSARVDGTRSQRTSLDELTEREHQILDLVAGGASNKEIAHTLNLTEKTVKYYMTNIMQKLGVRNRVEAAMYARATARRPIDNDLR